MADKQQNVKVVWNVDTSQLEKSTQLANQAQVAADKFHKSASQGAKANSAELNKLISDEKRLEAAIKSTHVSQFKNYKDFVKNLQQLSKQYSDVKIKIDFMNKALAEQAREQKKVADATKQTAQSTQNLSTQFGSLYTGIKAVLAAGLVRYAVSTTLEMARLAGNVEGVTRAFYRAFPNGAVLLNDLQRATHGAVSEFELMQRTLQATNLGVAVESLPVLFEFAATRAQQTGESVDYLVDSIVRGIGRKSILVLDNLGLSATRLREQFNGASLASQSVADVTRGVAEIAKVELEKMGGYAETSATKVDQLTVSWTRLKEELAKTITQEGGTVDFLKSYVDTYANLFEAINKGVTVAELANQKRAEEAAQNYVTAFSNDILTKSKEEQIEAIEEEIAILTKGVGSWMRFRDVMNENIETSKKEADATFKVGQNMFFLQKNIDQDVAALERLRDAKKDNIDTDIEVIKLLNLQIEALKKRKEVVDQIGLIQAKIDKIDSVEDKIKAAKSTAEIHKLNIELATLNGQLADLKAFGTTKQFLEVNGRVKLVPVEDYKIKQYKVQTTNALGELEVKTRLVLGTNQDPNVGIKQLENDIQNMIDQMRFTIPPPAALSQGITPMSDFERIGQEFSDNWKDILSTGIDDTTNFFDAVIQAEADQYDARVQQAARFYDEQILLAGDNERRQLELKIKSKREEDRLRRDAFEKEKEARRASTVINGAAGIVRAFATLDFYQAIAASAVIAAETIAQLAAINQQTARFKDGVIDLKGPVSKTSDSIPARLSRGESVMTADETSGARGILEDIRAGRLNDRVLAKTIDDKVLERLKLSGTGVSMVGMDDSRIVKEIHELKGSLEGFEEKHGQLWKYTKKSETMKQYVRAKSF
jgi:hypothetical protein